MSRDQENRWIIFDADNTLWNVEAFYNHARTEMANYVATLCQSQSADIESYQQERDRQLREIYGYSASRFARSFEDTICKFAPEASSEQVRRIRAIAEEVFAQKAELTPDVELVLRSLYSQGWHLGLLTAGEFWVQQKRVSEFHLQGIFHAIEVVKEKSAREFKQFCEKNNTSRRRRSGIRTNLHVISLLTGNSTGKIAVLGIRSRFRSRKPLCRSDYSSISLRSETGKRLRRTGIFGARTGNCTVRLPPTPVEQLPTPALRQSPNPSSWRLGS